MLSWLVESAAIARIVSQRGRAGKGSISRTLVGDRPQTLGSNHAAASQSSSQDSVDCSGWWRGKTVDAADRGPSQAGGAFRRHLPLDRLRALEHGERGS